jgi:hypothetical protein
VCVNIYIPLRNEEIELLHEICSEEEKEMDMIRLKRKIMVIVIFPRKMMEISSSYDEKVNDDCLVQTHILTKRKVWMEIEKIITKKLQGILKVAFNNVSCQNCNTS